MSVDPLTHFHTLLLSRKKNKNFIRYLEDALQNTGFDYGVSTILGRAGRNSNKYFLPRLPVNNWDDLSLLRAKLDGGYDWLHWLQLLKKSILHNPTLFQDGADVLSHNKW